MHLGIAAVSLGAGEPLLAGLNLLELGYRVVEQAFSDDAMHVVFARA